MWPVPCYLFWDSDITKWIEGACYFLADLDEYDEGVDQSVRELVDMISSAQQQDGYLNVHYTVVELRKRWTNIRDVHGVGRRINPVTYRRLTWWHRYNAGHLIEAAITHKEYYKNNPLLEPIEKYASLVKKGYISLRPSYLSENPQFSLYIHRFEPRFISPHPTHQHNISLARGPIFYCVEDFDNPSESNRFKGVFIRTDSSVTEEKVVDEASGEEYVAMQAKGWKQSPSALGSLSLSLETAESVNLFFVPYYFRANRGGNGQMRVGLTNGGIEPGILFPEILTVNFQGPSV
ncbi:hypothetical protein H9Q69_004716 [Fusarium xylarioides]|nr:hypothetical protein H9Q69_004716 [Fusarium xylarioides]KAG5817629.1 hypothetical protein H9Q71_001814 [Fusarium xylarioides]KAG5827787.1 hypothetical protein H9Q74_002128 [Fusarium xylarioides]